MPYPGFGLTSLLDIATARLPDDLADSYPTARPDDVARAALVTARLLERAGDHAESGLDRVTLPAAVRRRAAALAGGRAEALEPLLHPDFHWISHRGEVFDRAAYLRANTAGALRWHSQQIHDPQLDVVGPVGVVRCVVVDEVERDGVRRTLRMPVTQTWIRDGAGVWTCLAGHAGPA